MTRRNCSTARTWTHLPTFSPVLSKIETKIVFLWATQRIKSMLSQLQSPSPHLPWSMRAEHTGALAFDHGNFNQSFSHFIGNSLPPFPFKHCLGELSAAGSISGNYTCKVTLGAGQNISAKCMCCWEHWKVQQLHNAGWAAVMTEEWCPRVASREYYFSGWAKILTLKLLDLHSNELLHSDGKGVLRECKSVPWIKADCCYRYECTADGESEWFSIFESVAEARCKHYLKQDR